MNCMNRSVSFALLLATIFLGGCATTANFEKALESWIGRNADDLVSKWGPPSRTYPLSSGEKVFEYSSAREMQIGGQARSVPQTTTHSGSTRILGPDGISFGSYSGTSTTNVTTTSPVRRIALGCTARFTVNARNILVWWAWEGNDCGVVQPADPVPVNPTRSSGVTRSPMVANTNTASTSERLSPVTLRSQSTHESQRFCRYSNGTTLAIGIDETCPFVRR